MLSQAGRSEVIDLINALASSDTASCSTVQQQIEVLTPTYMHLLRLMGGSKPESRTEIETALHRASDVAIGSVGNWLINAAWIRAMVGHAGHWDSVGANAWAPSKRLISSLNGAIARNEGRGNPYVPLAKGILEFISGSDTQAYELFTAARENAWYWGLIRDDWRGSSTCRPFPMRHDLSDQESPWQMGNLEWHTTTVLSSTPYVISYSCDDVYFRAFAANIIASLPSDSTGINIHFHIINPSEECLTLCDVVSSVGAAKGASLQLSLEHAHVNDRAYFGSCRFMRLRELLDTFGRAMLLIDTDSTFRSDPRGWLGEFNQQCVNILFCRGPYGYVPWRSLWAGMVFVPRNAVGKEFAHVLRQVIGYLWNGERRANWWVDQNALYITFRLLQRYWGPEGFADIPSQCRGQVHTSEAYKLERLRGIGQVGTMLEKGRSWVDTLNSIQLSNGLPTSEDTG